MTKTTYVETKINLSESQKQKIASAYKNKQKITINFKPDNVGGTESFYFTRGQLSKMEKAFRQGKGVNINLSMAQIRYNAKHGGFLATLAGLASRALPLVLPFAGKVAKKVLPALGLGAISGLADKAVKSIFGDGLFISKNGQTAQVETDGMGLYLKPIEGSGFEGNGVFLVKNGHVQDGSGLLSSIPLIGPLLKAII